MSIVLGMGEGTRQMGRLRVRRIYDISESQKRKVSGSVTVPDLDTCRKRIVIITRSLVRFYGTRNKNIQDYGKAGFFVVFRNVF